MERRMELRHEKCPACNRTLNQHDDVYSCEEHGDWVFYGAHLLVRQPNAAALRHEVVAMPWE